MKIFKKDWFLIFIFYFFAFGLILFNKGIFWDDWVLYNTDKKIIINTFRQMGIVWIGYFYAYVLFLKKAILFHRILVFSAYFFSILLLNSILKTIKQIDNSSRFFIVLFFALFPLNNARIALITSLYTICYFTFFLAFWLLSRYLSKKQILLRIVSLIFFFISFSTNSFLVFYALPLLYILYSEVKNITCLKDFLKKILEYLDFIILPLAFWLIKNTYFKPYGLYINYNQITLNFLKKIPVNLVKTFYFSFSAIIDNSFQFFFSNPFLVLIVSILIFQILKFKQMGKFGSKNVNIKILFAGIFAFTAGTIPYLAVGKIPNNYDWTSRYQFLLALGASLIFFAIINLILSELKSNSIIKIFIFSLFVVLFLNQNIQNYLSWQIDWYKQLSLIENFKDNKIIINNTTFLFEDNTVDLNANKRLYRFYEYTGLMKYAFGEEKRFGCGIDKFDGSTDIDNKAYYNLKDYKPISPQYKIFIDYGLIKINNINVIKFMVWEIFEPKKFNDVIKNIIKLSFVKVS